MRDLLFKNLTSSDKKRKVISSSEIMDQQGVHSVIRRHFVCLVKEVESKGIEKPLPHLYVLKEHNSKKRIERFFCKIKSSLFAVSNDKIYLILFMHTLKIDLCSVSKSDVISGN